MRSQILYTLTSEEMDVLALASKKGLPVLINGTERVLRPFNLHGGVLERTCEGCPDEVHISDLKGRPCLYAVREQGSDVWKFSAVRSAFWGFVGWGTELKALRAGDESIGNVLS